MTRAEILDKAKECVCGQREQDYGKPEDNFATIAALWGAYKDTEFSAEDVSVMMALMKIARIKTGTSTDDCFVDLAGYAACGGEIASVNKKEADDRDDGVGSISEALASLGKFLKREEKWRAAGDKREFRVLFKSHEDFYNAGIRLLTFLHDNGRISIGMLREIVLCTCGKYVGTPIDCYDLGWDSSVDIRFTGDGGGNYILILPYPTSSYNKEDI